MIGRRRPDSVAGSLPDDLQPGDYWKLLDPTGEHQPVTPLLYSGSYYTSNLTNEVWQFYSPDGNGIGTLVAHTVREHEDGAISVLPGDGSSNSILHSGARDASWHGYIHHGEWREC